MSTDATRPRYEDVLRRLAISDDRFLASILVRAPSAGPTGEGGDGPVGSEGPAQREQTRRLVDFAAVVAADASPASIGAAVSSALAAGVMPEEIVETLVRTTPAVGTVRVVAVAPHVAAALGYDLWRDLEDLESEPPGQLPRSDRH